MRMTLDNALGRTDVARALRICWPPDKVCLQGGCCHCIDANISHTVERVAAFAQRRGMGEDFAYGLQHNWAERL